MTRFTAFKASLLVCVAVGLGTLPAIAAPRDAQPKLSRAGRPLVTSLTCSAAQSLVTARQRIVLATGPDLYDRYVAQEGLCDVGQEGHPAFVATTTNPACLIGYYCLPRSIDGF